MKFSFKKIASVLASAVMLSSTLGIALAASYPDPFVVGGAAQGAIVVTSGTHAGSAVDLDAAVDLQKDLNALVTVKGTSEATATIGDSLKIEKASNKLNMQNAITDVWTTKITDDNLPTLLGDGTYDSKDNKAYSYEQTIEFDRSAGTSSTIANPINWTHFSDSDYKSKEPSLGIQVARNARVFNYTLSFLKYPRSDVTGSGSSGKLEDLEDTDITILGKTYKLLNAYNKSTSTKFELMTGTVTDTINLNEEKTEAIEAKKYTITLKFVDADEVQFDVVDSEGTAQTTTKLLKGGTYKLKDDTQLGVTDISYQGFSGGVMSAEFTLGANKLTIENGEVIELNDEDENDINGFIGRSEVSATQVDIKSITLEWKTTEKMFVTSEESVTMPGLGSIKFSAADFTRPKDETVKVEPTGSYGIELTVPIKDGETKVDILYGNQTDFKWIADDNDATGTLRTANRGAGGEIVFDLDTDEYFFASWNDSKSGESYLLDITAITEDTTVHKNYTTIKNVVTGETVADKKKQDDKITIGNVELTLNKIDKTNNWANISINDGGSFSNVISKEGLYLWLPMNYSGTPGAGAPSSLKGLFVQEGADVGQDGNQTSWTLWMAEEDKDGDIGDGQLFNITCAHTSDKSEAQADKATNKWSAADIKEIGDTEVYEGYIASDLGTKVIYKQPSGAQNSVELHYWGDEAYANVFVTALGVSVGRGEETIVVVKDSEVSSVSNKNLIIVGGSCINSVAASVLGVSYPTCGADFTTATNVDAGKYLVKAIKSPYNAAKTAVLVAGYEAADTKSAAAKLKEGVTTDVGTSNIYPAATA